MHAYSPAFHSDEENAKLADEYGIVMGSSHCEPLLRNNLGELDTFQEKWESENPDKTLYKALTNETGTKVAYYWTDHDNNNNPVDNKEFLKYYNSGQLQIPEDVTIMWTDDNYGYVRQNADDAERANSGRTGIYYHISYYGYPTSYLWLTTTQPGLIREEMAKYIINGAGSHPNVVCCEEYYVPMIVDKMTELCE